MSALIPGLAGQLSLQAEVRARTAQTRRTRLRAGGLAIAAAALLTGGAAALGSAGASSRDCPLNRVAQRAPATHQSPASLRAPLGGDGRTEARGHASSSAAVVTPC